MVAATAAKSEEKKSKAAVRPPASCEGQQCDESAGAAAGVPLFLKGGCGCPDCAEPVQAKLVVGQVGDAYEQQADRVADRASTGTTPRWAAKSLSTRVSHHASSSASSIPASDSGSPLNPEIRQRVEPSLGADLSQVRVHGNPSDREVARGLGAQAFTHRSHIWLGPSQSSTDVKLMAHEATHVVQQGAAPGKTPAVQRQEDDTDSPPDAAERGKPDTGPFREMLKEIPKGGPPQNGNAPDTPKERPDPAKVASKKAELRAKGQPAVNRANRDQPRLQKAAQGAKTEAHKPSTTSKGAKDRAAGAKTGKKDGKKAGGKGAGGHGGKISMGLSRPTTPPQVQPPKIAAPVDAAGKPLRPDLAGDAGIVKLVVMAQAMRLKGFMLREQAAQERHNAGVIQHNLGKVNEGVAQADEGIGKSEEHLAYRREVTGQTEGALNVSEQKAETVATQAPKYQSTSAEGKTKSGPMSGEAKDLAAENASKTPDDDDGAEKAQEQGQKLGKVGSDIGSMDDAMTQTKAKADSLAGDAAKAKQKNTQTKQNITGTHAALDQTGAKVTQMSGQNATAKAQAAAHASAPAHMAAAADALDQQGLDAIQSSIAMEQRLHATQQKYLDGMRSVPQSKLGKAAANGGSEVLVQRQAEPGSAPAGATNPNERINLNLAGKVGEALPSWLTGEEKETEEQRAEAQAAEQKRRADEIKDINDKAGGDFSKLTAADKAGIALSLTGRHLFGSVAGIKWPNFLGKMLQGLIDPRMALMGIVSGLSMVLSGAANLFSAEQWKKDPLGNLLKSAADIATGITIVLGAITALAMAIIAIMIAAAIFSFGFLGPLAAAVIPFCTTVVGTVGPWTLEAAAIALELNILVMIKDLVDAATAETAETLQGESDKVTEDAKNAGNMALQIGMAAAGEAGGEALASTKFGQGMAAGMRDIGEDFGIVKPAAGPPPVPEGAAVEPPAAPAAGEAAPTPKAEATPAPAEPAAAPKAEAGTPAAETAPAPKAETAPAVEQAPTPKAAEAPAPSDPAATPKAEATPGSEPSAATKAETTPSDAPAETTPDSKPAEPAEGQPKPEEIAAEQPAANGHKAKVTKDGECLICTDCENANAVIEKQLEAGEVPPAEKARIEAELDDMNQIKDPATKAQAAAEIHQEATDAVAKAQEAPGESPEAGKPVDPSEAGTKGPQEEPKVQDPAPDKPEQAAGTDEQPVSPENEPEESDPTDEKSAREKASDEINDRIKKAEQQKAAELEELKTIREEARAKGQRLNEAYERVKASSGTEDYPQALKDWKEARAAVTDVNERTEGYEEKISDLSEKQAQLKESLAEGARRETYMGATPGKASPQGLEVQARMREAGTLRNNPDTGAIEFQASNEKWYPLEDADMCHYPQDAVKWWNETGRFYGAKAPQVRAWMLNAKNYILDHFSLNRSAGARLGEEYLPPAR